MEDILKNIVGNKRKRNRVPSRKSSPEKKKTVEASVQSSSFVMGSSPTLPFLENRTEDSRESMIFTDSVDERTLFNEMLREEPDLFRDGKLLPGEWNRSSVMLRRLMRGSKYSKQLIGILHRLLTVV